MTALKAYHEVMAPSLRVFLFLFDRLVLFLRPGLDTIFLPPPHPVFQHSALCFFYFAEFHTFFSPPPNVGFATLVAKLRMEK